MNTRLIIHYLDGQTYTSDWNVPVDFTKLNRKSISSLQLQTNSGKLHTLSSKKGKRATFWYRETYDTNNEMTLRNILKRLSKSIWVELRLSVKSGERRVQIIKEDIKVN